MGRKWIRNVAGFVRELLLGASVAARQRREAYDHDLQHHVAVLGRSECHPLLFNQSINQSTSSLPGNGDLKE